MTRNRYTSTLRRRLLSKRSFNDETGCWEWTGFRSRDGYGQIRYGTSSAGIVYVHRASYEVFKGPIPEGQVVCHACDNPPCFNPDHLFLGSQTDNMRDAQKKGRLHSATPRFMEKVRRLYRTGETITALSKRFNIPRTTIRRWCQDVAVEAEE